MPIAKDFVSPARAGKAVTQLLEQGPVVGILWQLTEAAKPEEAASYHLVYTSHDVDPTTGVDYRPLIGMSIAEAFPDTIGGDLPRTVGACLADGQSRDLPDFPYEDERFPASWWRISVHRIADNLAGLLCIDVTQLRQTQDKLEAAQAELAHRLGRSHARFETIFRNAGLGIALVDAEGRPVEVNPALASMLGYDAQELRPMPFTEFTHPDDVSIDWDLYTDLVEGRRDSYHIEKRYVRKDGSILHGDLTVSAVRGEGGGMEYAVGMVLDIGQRERAERTIAQQAEEILELSTPVMGVWPGVVLAPLIGALDSARTQRFTEALLESIASQRADVALVDITGVPAVDTQTAQHLIEAITASRLLGARVILTGVRPAIAQTLVHLGIDLGSVETCSALAEGLARALGRRTVTTAEEQIHS